MSRIIRITSPDISSGIIGTICSFFSTAIFAGPSSSSSAPRSIELATPLWPAVVPSDPSVPAITEPVVNVGGYWVEGFMGMYAYQKQNPS
uniref:Uncharacterized protein n=1 Tax=Pristionchus pacificus TaxID=54126 RepID=A0A2A6BL44_PRIPA|eukprot:PDM66568.1 hypothetical protein PRIPAC_47985 [Pristionchus pacificus]